jgi:hypothetical protein
METATNGEYHFLYDDSESEHEEMDTTSDPGPALVSSSASNVLLAEPPMDTESYRRRSMALTPSMTLGGQSSDHRSIESENFRLKVGTCHLLNLKY